MTEESTSVLIVAKPTRMREGLRALLMAMPQLKIIGQVDDGPSAMQMISDHHPALILLDSNLPEDEAWVVLKQVKNGSNTRCLVLADTVQQQRVARAEGADDVLLTGVPAAKLFTTIERLLPDTSFRSIGNV